jgi:hypothetical protein
MNSSQAVAKLFGVEPVSMNEMTEHPRLETRRMDFLGRLSDGGLLHIEWQSSRDREMAIRMLEYFLLIRRRVDAEAALTQRIVYVGSGEPNWRQDRINVAGTEIAFDVLHMREFDRSPFLESDMINDNLLGILCCGGADPDYVDAVVHRLAGMQDNAARNDAAQKLGIVLHLRSDEIIIDRKVRTMLADIQIDFKSNPLFAPHAAKLQQEASAEAARNIIVSQLTAVFNDREKAERMISREMSYDRLVALSPVVVTIAAKKMPLELTEQAVMDALRMV